MGSLQYQKRKAVGRNSAVNLSKSGVSLSHSRGPVTVNSRGGASVRLLPGFSYRIRGKSGAGLWIGLAIMAVYALLWATWAIVRLGWVAVVSAVRLAGRMAGSRKSAESPPAP